MLVLTDFKNELAYSKIQEYIRRRSPKYQYFSFWHGQTGYLSEHDLKTLALLHPEHKVFWDDLLKTYYYLGYDNMALVNWTVTTKEFCCMVRDCLEEDYICTLEALLEYGVDGIEESLIELVKSGLLIHIPSDEDELYDRYELTLLGQEFAVR